MVQVRYSNAWAIFIGMVILATIGLSWWLAQAPAPLSEEAPATEFSAARAMKHIEAMAKEQHPASSFANNEVYDYILDQVHALGLEVEVIEGPETRGGNYVEWPRAILGRIRGVHPTKAFAVDAHFDSTPYGPGAADDLSGIAAMLETARALKARKPMMNDVILVFADQEEVGGNGAHAFTRHPWFQEVGVMLGLEARGVRGPSLMFETSNNNGRLIRELKRSGVAARANSVMFSVYDRLPFGSDFGAYKQHVPGYNIAYVDGFGYYHIRLDRPDKVSLASVQHHGDYTLGLANHLGNIPLDNFYAPNATYFNLLGSYMVVHPQTWDAPIMMAVLLLFVVSIIAAVYTGAIRIRGLLSAWGLHTICLLLAMAVCAPALSSLVLYREASLYQNTLYCAGLMLLGVGVIFLVYGCARNRVRGAEMLAAILFFWSALLYPMHTYLSGGTHIVVWPIFFGSASLLMLAFAYKKKEEPSPAVAGMLTLWMLPVVAVFTPLLEMFSFTLTPLGTFIINAALVLLAGLLAQQIFLIAGSRRMRLAGIAFLLGIILFTWGLIANRPGPDTPKLNCVSYAANFDTGEAWWVSSDRTTREWFRDVAGYSLPGFLFAHEKPIDEWTEQFFPDGTTRGTISEFRNGDKRKYLKAPAPAPNFDPFQMVIVGDSMEENRRVVMLRLQSPRLAGRIRIEKRFDGPVHAARLDGKELTPSEGDWQLSFMFLPEAGAVLTLEVNPDAVLQFWVREESWAYPRFANYTERPDHMAAEPNRVIDFHRRLHSEHTYTLCTVVPKAMETSL